MFAIRSRLAGREPFDFCGKLRELLLKEPVLVEAPAIDQHLQLSLVPQVFVEIGRNTLHQLRHAANALFAERLDGPGRALHLFSEKTKKRREHRVFADALRLRLCGGNHEHTAGSDDVSFDLSAELGVAVKERALETQGERVAGASLLPAIHACFGASRLEARPI